jgi:hypothetical protein
MATLVLTTLGTALGGPLGGAIGALAGQALDAQIFKPKARNGPRLSDLSVQTSRYGTAIPQLFGTMRVAGTVIWATDLRESSATSGGKGRPSVTSFSYSASLAIALSSRPIIGIGRIWADGNLLRGSAGDFKVPLGALRVHHGSAGQAVDPLIAAAVGVTQAPAFRGLAYMVLEDLQLADFGNRLPSLTIEVIADTGGVAVAAIASELSGLDMAYAGPQAPMVQGYAADGGDIGEAIGPLVEAYRLRWRFTDAGAALIERMETGRVLARDRALLTVDGRRTDANELQRLALDQLPVRLSVRHFDAARDYQLGVQSAERSGSGQRSEELGLPAVIPADAARRLADAAMRARLAGRRRMVRACDWSALDLQVGDVLSIEGETGAWVVDGLEWDDMAVRLTLLSEASGTATPPAAGDAGHPVLPIDLVQGATSLALVELAAPDDALAQAPLIFAAATGTSAGWRRAALFVHDAETEVARSAGMTAPHAVLGTALAQLLPGAAWIFDTRCTVDIALDHPADSLVGADDEELLRGANLCALGRELLQFGEATLIAPGQYRLSRLVRGWRGTEWAMTDHAVGERFVLLDPARLAPISTTAADIGRLLQLRASGIGDDEPAEVAWTIDGRAMLPPSPVQGAWQDIDGDLHIGWTRRSRLGWLWRDNADAPLGEEAEAYRLAVHAGSRTLRELDVPASRWTYTATDRAADLLEAGAEPVVLTIRQIGTFGPGQPLTLTLN